MNIKQITFFVKTFELRNISKASKALFVAQPALSHQISNLEKNLGISLFTRTPQGVIPTEKGEIFYRHAIAILRQIENTRDLLASDKGGVSGKVSIAMPSSTSRAISNFLLRDVIKYYPDIMLEIIDAPSADLISLVEHGRVDLAIIPMEPYRKGVTFDLLLKEQLFLITKNFLQSAVNEINIHEVSMLPMILPSKPNSLRGCVDRFFLENNIDYKLLAEASTSSVLVAAVKNNLAATVLPWSAVQEEVQSGDLHAVQLPYSVYRELAICKADSMPFTMAAEKIESLCYEIVNKMIDGRYWQGATS